MPLQRPRRHGVDVHINVRVIGVNPYYLRVRGRYGLDGNAVILLLVDDFDAIRDARGRVNKVCAVIQLNRTAANEVTRGTKRLAQLTRRPSKHLVLRGEDGQALGRPRVNHLLHGNERIVSRGSRGRLAFSKHPDEPQCAVDEFTSGRLRGRRWKDDGHGDSLLCYPTSVAGAGFFDI